MIGTLVADHPVASRAWRHSLGCATTSCLLFQMPAPFHTIINVLIVVIVVIVVVYIIASLLGVVAPIRF